jgi:DNA anti-recombination protein RmuC
MVSLTWPVYRARIFIVSPTILMLAIQVVQQMRRDERMREAADLIREEVMKLLDDVGRLGDRVRKLDGHFKNVNEDVRLAIVSLEKVEGRGERIRRPYRSSSAKINHLRQRHRLRPARPAQDHARYDDLVLRRLDESTWEDHARSSASNFSSKMRLCALSGTWRLNGQCSKLSSILC